MFPSLIEVLPYLAYFVAWGVVIVLYGPYAIYLILKRKPQHKTHGVCLAGCVCALLGLNIWQQSRPSDTYTITEAISPSQEGSVILLHEAAFQDSQTHLCVRDYSRSGRKLIHIGVVEGEGVHSEDQTWSADGSNVVVKMSDKPGLGYDFRIHKALGPAEIESLLLSQRAIRHHVKWEGGYRPSYRELKGFRD
jgi:hypothetical protein